MLVIAGVAVTLPRQAFAQDDLPCGTVATEGYRAPHEVKAEEFARFRSRFAERLQTRAASRRGSNVEVDTVPVNVYIFRRNDGTGGLTEARLLEVMTKLNADYDSVGLYFTTCTPQIINSTKYYDFRQEEESELRDEYYTREGLNIYFANTIAGRSGALCGYAYYPYGGRNVILMNNSCALNGSTLSHEVGHAYGLPHTHGYSNSDRTDELVDGSNCASAGDSFCDTPADPQLSTALVGTDCVYSGTATDTSGAAYTPDVSNHMSYSRASCRRRFSVEQMAAMKFNSGEAWDRIDLACDNFTGDFEVASATGGAQFCNDDLSVRLTAVGVGATAYSWDINADGSVEGTGPSFEYTFPTAGTYSVALTLSNGTEQVRRVKRNFIVVGPRPLPIVQAFEREEAVRDYFWRYGTGAGEAAWVLRSGSTPSNSTGPEGGRPDRSTGAASDYLYVEASGEAAGTPAVYRSGCIAVPRIDTLLREDSLRFARPVLSFYYHMYGNTMGDLHVDIETATGIVRDVTPALIGEQQSSTNDTFRLREVDLSAYAGQRINIRFRGMVGSSFRSDMAIDDVSVALRPEVIVGVTQLASAERRPTLYPNPATREIRVDGLADGSTVGVRNALGQLVVPVRPYAGQIVIDALASGFYTVEVRAPSGKTAALPLVVR